MEKEQILIIKTTAIGDTVIALPHIEAICAYHRQADVWLMTAPPSKSIYAHHPHLKLTIFDRDQWFGRDAFWQKLWWVRKQKFARIYDLQGNRISRLLTRYSGSPIRVGTNPKRAYSHSPTDHCLGTTHKNVFDRLNEVLLSAGLPATEKKARIYLETDDILKVEQSKKAWQLADKHYVVMHAGSSGDRPAKRWPVENYLKLAQRIESRGLKCVWVGTEPEREINAYLSRQVGIDSTGIFTLRQLFGFAQKALFAVSSDSCPMHIFAAAGIPVYCFFGPENWRWSHPLGQRDRVLRNDVACSPCFRGVCPKEKGHACLEGVSPASVFAKIDMELTLTKR